MTSKGIDTTISSETRWVIIGEHGLYTGQYQTRKEAIKDHIMSLYGDAGSTDDSTKRLWKVCQAKGDRAVKAQITWENK